MMLYFIAAVLIYLLGILSGVMLTVYFDYRAAMWGEIPDDQQEEFDYYGLEQITETYRSRSDDIPGEPKRLHEP